MTGRRLVAATAILAASVALPAAAKDMAPCAAGMICASNPQSVVAALQKTGYKAQLTTDGEGDPEVDSSAAGYDYQILFYDCEAHQHCASVQFYASFKPSAKLTPSFVSEWNHDQRFLSAATLKDGGISLAHDLSTIGGLNQVNFADNVEWMNSALQSFDKKLESMPGK